MAHVTPEVDFCRFVHESKEITNATARIGAWIVAHARAAGGFPVHLTPSAIRQGTGARHETITKALAWLESEGLISSEPGEAIGFGHVSRRYSWRRV